MPMFWLLPLVAAALLVPAFANGFPLIFPDSGTYLNIAFASAYAVDRSSAYGFFLKPLVAILPGLGGLWLAIGVQALVVAGALLLALRMLLPAARAPTLLGLALLTACATALPWHAGQFMPDAFTAPLLLLGWAAVTRSPRADGAALLWFAAMALAVTHYTHVVLLAVTVASAVFAQAMLGLPWRAALARLAAAAVATLVAVGVLVAANGVVLGRWALSPAGPFFLFARLTEDGLTKPWLDERCRAGDPPGLCAVRDEIPQDSQVMLWGGAASPIAWRIWQSEDPAARWRWLDAMAEVNRGAILARPLPFLAAALDGTAQQLITFSAIDDECPKGCGDLNGGIGWALARYRPAALSAQQQSMQRRDTTPKALVRTVTTPVTAAAMLALPILLIAAWRRRDALALSLVASLSAALVVNAAMAGTLSDVHDRYQSRLAWAAPLVLFALLMRWRGHQPRVR